MEEVKNPLASPPVVIAGLTAAFLGAALMAGISFLETKWLAVFIVVLAIFALAVLSRQFERFMLALFFIAIPFNVDFHWHPVEVAPGIQEMGISTLDILLAFLYGIWIFRRIVGHQGKPMAWPRGLTPLLGLVIWSALSLANAHELFVGFFMLTVFFKALLYFFYFANLSYSRQDLNFFANCLMAGLIVESAIAMAQYAKGGLLGLEILGERRLAKEVLLGGDPVFRIGGTLGHPNAFGGYLAGILPVGLALNFVPLGRIRRIFLSIALGLGTLTLILSFSRSAWIGAMAAILGVMGSWMIRMRDFRRLAPALVGGVALGAAVIAFMPMISARWAEDDEGSTLSRVAQMRVAAGMIKAHPFLGVGMNNYEEVMEFYQSYVEKTSERGRVNRVHNIFVSQAAEAGLPSLVWYGAFLFVVYKRLREKRRLITDDTSLAIYSGMGWGLIARMLHDSAHTGNIANNLLFWIITGMIAADHYLDESSLPVTGNHS